MELRSLNLLARGERESGGVPDVGERLTEALKHIQGGASRARVLAEREHLEARA